MVQFLSLIHISIVYADASTMGSSGKPLLVEQEDEVWLTAGLVSAYTDIRTSFFKDGDAKRVFVDTSWEPEQVAAVKKDGSVRVRGGVKSCLLYTSRCV